MMEDQGEQFASKASLPIKGHLKVETGNNKGALRCGVQNLKYYDKGDYIYKLILFGKKGEKTIHTILGTLLVNRQGNGETYFRFQPLNMDGKGNAYHDFSTAIIAAASTVDEKEPLHPILKGTISGDNQPFQWSPLEGEKGEPLAEQQEEALAKEEKVAAKPTISPENKAERKLDGMEAIEAIKELLKGSGEAPPKEDREEAPQAEKKAREESTAARGPVSKKVYNNFYNEYVLHACAHTCKVAEFYEDVMPFGKDKTGAQWKKIGNVMNLPLVSPGAHYFASQYQHYLFGAKADENGMAVKYYFGIPGRFLAEEQPDGGRSGFTFWQPIRGADVPTGSGSPDKMSNRSSAYGYWILAVDGRTGDLEEV